MEPLRGVLQQLVSKDGDTIPFPPDTIIVNDIGSNMHRLERIIEQLDTRASSDEMRIIQIQYATARTWPPPCRSCSRPRRRPGQRPGGFVAHASSPGAPPGEVAAGRASQGRGLRRPGDAVARSSPTSAPTS